MRLKYLLFGIIICISCQSKQISLPDNDLLDAVSACDLAKVKVLISNKTNINDFDSQGDSILNISARCNVSLTRHLIDNGADISLRSKDGSHTALMTAAFWENIETIHLLIRKGANPFDVDDLGMTARERIESYMLKEGPTPKYIQVVKILKKYESSCRLTKDTRSKK